MRRLLLILVLLIPALSWAQTCGNGYSGGPMQVLLHKAVGGSDISNYIYDMTMTRAEFKDSGHGGGIQHTATNPAGYTGTAADFVICDAASSGNTIKYDSPFYDGTNGIIELHFLMATLHAASNDSIYIFWNNSGVSTTQQDLSFYSTANVLAVYHFGTASTLSTIDSRGSFNGTNHSATATTGLNGGGAVSFSGSSQNITTSLITNATTNVTMEMWINYSGLSQLGVLLENGSGSGGNGYNTAIITSSCGNAQGVNMVLEGVGCGAGGIGSFPIRPGWHHLYGGRNATNWHLYVDGVVMDATGATNNPNTPTTRTTIGGDGSNTVFANAILDEVREYSVAPSANWAATTAKIGWLDTPYMVVETPTYTTPTERQFANCQLLGTLTCTLPFDLTSGGLALTTFVTIGAGGDCLTASTPTDTLGLTHTVSSSAYSVYHGTLRDYFSCLDTAPITTTGSDTVTYFNANMSVRLVELKGATTSGMATASAGNNTQPHSFSATSPSSNSILYCWVPGDSTNVSASTTPTYPLFEGWEVDPKSSDHAARVQLASTLVGSGSQSCQFNADSHYSTAGPGGAMAILPFSSPTPSSGPKHRVVNE